MESSLVSPLSSPAEISQPWLQQVLRQKLGASLKLNTWSIRLPETRSGFMSEVCFVQTRFSISEGSPEENRSLFAKFMPDTDKDSMEAMKSCCLAEREVGFYKRAFSEEFKVFCGNSGLDNPVPEVYWAGIKDDKITIVLHDLCSDGFRLSIPPEGNSLKQIKCILATVAVIHGAGIATIKKHGKHPGDVPLDNSTYRDFIVGGMSKLIKMFEGTTTFDTLKAILSQLDRLLTVEEKYPLLNTLIHGDLWSANLMLSQDDQKACIFDWQFARVGNMVCDIVTLLLMSGEASCYTEHLPEILECYWKSFEQSLKKNGVTVDISFQDLVCNVESMWIFGYLFFSASLQDLFPRFITEDRVLSVTHFLERKGVFKKFLS